MSIWGKIFGTQKVIDGVMKGADKLVYTDQEKKETFERLLTLYEPFKLAQRLLAVIYSVPFVLIHFVCFIGEMINIALGNDYGIFKPVMEINNETLGLPCLTILGFYFAGGCFEGVVRARAKKNESN